MTSNNKIVETVRNGDLRHMLAAALRLRKQTKGRKILRVPQHHMDLATYAMSRAGVIGNVTNIKGSKSRKVTPSMTKLWSVGKETTKWEMGDEFKWGMGEIRPPDSIKRFQRNVLSIILFDKTWKPIPIGSGFIVSCQGRSAVAMSASHIFEGIHKREHPYLISHPTAPLEFIVPKPMNLDHAFETHRLRALYVADDLHLWCEITGVHFVPFFDSAIFSIDLPNEYEGPDFGGTFAIDTSVPKVGTQVGVMGYWGPLEFDYEPEKSTDTVTSWGYPHAFEFRIGQITEVLPKGDPLLKVPCFRMSMPIPGGMSGGPVLYFGQNFKGSHIVCGIASKDFSVEGSFSDSKTAGDSTAAMLWPSVCLEVNAADRSSGATMGSSLFDLITGLHVIDHGDAPFWIKVEKTSDGGRRITRGDE